MSAGTLLKQQLYIVDNKYHTNLMQICKRFKVKFVESNIIIIIAIYKKINLWKRHAK